MVKRRFLFGFICILLIISSILAGCAQSTSTPNAPAQTTSSISPPTSSATGPSSTGTTVPPSTSVTTSAVPSSTSTSAAGAPKYGGTLTVRTDFDFNGMNTDPYINLNWSAGDYMYWLESPTGWNWTINPSEWSFKGDFNPPQYLSGQLAESWDTPDPSTLIYHLRQGIMFQGNSQVPTRELTADDVVFHYDRMLGLGEGFTTPSPSQAGIIGQIASVTAQDKYTVVIKFKAPSFSGLLQTVCELSTVSFIEDPDAVKTYGDLSDWHNAVGYGPWEITDLTAGSSATYTKNPNYYGYDARYPQNRLPYADKVVVLGIPDDATTLAALRTGKIDIAVGLIGLTPQQGVSLKKTDPQILQTTIPMPGPSVDFRVDKEPFTDINVRKALQMAVDIPAISQSLYYGTMSSDPALASPVAFGAGWITPFKEWPQSLQDEYTYNLSGARQLLTEAGYPHGFDTDVIAASNSNLDVLQAIQGEFKDIGVNMTIKTMDPTQEFAYASQLKTDQMVYTAWSGLTWPPVVIAMFRTTKMSTANFTANNDPNVDKQVFAFLGAQTSEDAGKIFNELNMYNLQQHDQILLGPVANIYGYQPYLKGYSGQIASYGEGELWAHLWIDKGQ